MDSLLRRLEVELEWVRSVNYYSVQIAGRHSIFSMSYVRNKNPNERNVCHNSHKRRVFLPYEFARVPKREETVRGNSSSSPGEFTFR